MIIWRDCTLILYHATNLNNFHDILIICVAANSLINQTTFKGIAGEFYGDQLPLN